MCIRNPLLCLTNFTERCRSAPKNKHFFKGFARKTFQMSRPNVGIKISKIGQNVRTGAVRNSEPFYTEDQ